MYHDHLNDIRKYSLTSIILRVGLIGYLIWSILGTYKYINIVSDNMAPLVLANIAMPNTHNPIDDKVFNKSYVQFVTSIGGKSPISYIYNVMPYYKSKNKHLKIYEDEIAGYFHMPTSEEFINLNKENIYMPEFPIPKVQEINGSQLSDPKYLISKFYAADKEVELDEKLLNLWDFEELAQRETRIDTTVEGPQVLVFHTHVSERYKEEGEGGQGVATVGEELCSVLEEKYGIETMHVTDSFGPIEGAYERMEPVIKNILEENPSIQVCIDLHRDGVRGDTRLVTQINGKPTAKVMFVNGLCVKRDLEGGVIPHKELVNPYIEDNLALSLQAQMEGLTYYPSMMRKIYLKSYRYSNHMKPLSLIIEVGGNNETLEEAVNAAEPIADIIAKVFEKD